MSYQHIGFIGLGLIGGSLAKLIRQHDPSIRLFGFSRSEKTVQYALDHHMIDSVTTVRSDIPLDLDLVFICTPICLINEYIAFLTEHISKPFLITDVGSIKQGIGQDIVLKDGHHFVGGHPMAGSEKVGIQYSDANMMKKATYILIKQDYPQYTQFAHFIQTLGFNLLELNRAKDHDYLVAYASHLPYLMAQLTVKNVEMIPKAQRALFQKIISSGFYDTTRVASSSLEWGMDVCRYNRENLMKSLAFLRENLTYLERLLLTQNWDELSLFLEKNKEAREEILEMRNGK